MQNRASSQIRIVTYNLLSPALSSPNSHLKCDTFDLDPPERLKKIKQKILTQVIHKKAICCLQEVGLSWKADLWQLFDDHEYSIIDTHYGTSSNDYMGICIAFPFYLYKCHASRVERLSESYIDYESSDFFPEELQQQIKERDAAKEKDLKEGGTGYVKRDNNNNNNNNKDKTVTQTDKGGDKSDEGFVDKFKPKDPVSQIKDDALRLWNSIKSWWKGEVKTESSWEIAERRMNRVLMCRFHRVEDHSDVFAVANYHNPCLFGSEEKVRALALHTAWLVQSFQEFAGEHTPRILCGDFNFTPTNSKIYEYITSGDEMLMDEIGFMNHKPDRYRLFVPDLIPVDSAYAVFNKETRVREAEENKQRAIEYAKYKQEMEEYEKNQSENVSTNDGGESSNGATVTTTSSDNNSGLGAWGSLDDDDDKNDSNDNDNLNSWGGKGLGGKPGGFSQMGKFNGEGKKGGFNGKKGSFGIGKGSGKKGPNGTWIEDEVEPYDYEAELKKERESNPNYESGEPRFTVYASGRTELEPEFLDTLDYIFLSKSHWEVEQTLPLPSENEAKMSGVMPNFSEPSDHLMLAATLTCRKFNDYVRW